MHIAYQQNLQTIQTFLSNEKIFLDDRITETVLSVKNFDAFYNYGKKIEKKISMKVILNLLMQMPMLKVVILYLMKLHEVIWEKVVNMTNIL